MAGCLYAQSEVPKENKNAILTDLNPMLTALTYLQIDVKGFGLEFAYERAINDHFSLVGDTKTLQLFLSDMHFSVWDFGLSGRYYPVKNEYFFTNSRTGISLYRTSLYQGWMLNIGLEAGWKLIIKSNFVLEPYIGCHVSSDDKFIMPFTITALSGLIIPGLAVGMRFGVGF